jgi:hypothetical protein
MPPVGFFFVSTTARREGRETDVRSDGVERPETARAARDRSVTRRGFSKGCDECRRFPGGRGGDAGAGREDGTSRAGSRTGLPVLVGHVRRRGVGARVALASSPSSARDVEQHSAASCGE